MKTTKKTASKSKTNRTSPARKATPKTVEPRPAKRKVIVSLAQYEAEAAASKAPAGGQPLATAEQVAAAVEAFETAKPTPGPKARISGLDAAAQVLGEAGTPLNAKEMVQRMLSAGLWSTRGRTPSATIYAAIIREIAAKGAASRFRKTDRGRFELAR